MEEALLKIGLPVKCRHCDKNHMVRPGTDYDGWTKSKVTKKWSCPEHSAEGMDNSFKRRYAENTPLKIKPAPYQESEVEKVDELEELLNLID